jgi:hypothetical protein
MSGYRVEACGDGEYWFDHRETLLAICSSVSECLRGCFHAVKSKLLYFSSIYICAAYDDLRGAVQWWRSSLVRSLHISSPELVIKIGAAYLFVRSHLFGIGWLVLHDAATARSSLVVGFLWSRSCCRGWQWHWWVTSMTTLTLVLYVQLMWVAREMCASRWSCSMTVGNVVCIGFGRFITNKPANSLLLN